MKLERCKCCKIPVSPNARSCPSCGEPNPANKSKGILASLSRLVLILSIFVLMIIYVFGGTTSVEIQPAFYLFVLLAGGFFVRLLMMKEV